MSDFAALCRPISTHIKKMAGLVALLLILASVDADAQCNRYSSSWVFTMYQPTAGSVFTQGQTITFEWGYSYNPVYLSIYVRLEWSTNGGSTWNLIQSSIYGQYSTRMTYNWVVPLTQTPSTNYIVRVREDYQNYGCWNGSYEMNGPGQTGTFTIKSLCNNPVISTQPTSSAVCVGLSKTFTVASDMTSGTYQWRKDGVTIATTTTPSYTVSPVTLADAGNYTVLLTQNCDTQFKTTSSTATLTVNVPPVVSKQPPATLVTCLATDDTIKAGGTGPGKTFQWYKDGAALSGANDSNFILRNITPAMAGSYWVVVSGTCSPAATSNTTAVTVVAPPVFTSEPTSLALCPGSSGQLTTVATGSMLTYQWYRNGVATPVTTANYPFTSYSTTMDGQYHVVVSSSVPNPRGCDVTTTSAIVTVTGYRPPVLLKQPVPVEGCIGKSVSLTSDFEGFGLTYSWARNGAAIPNSGSNSLLLSNLTPAHAGDYTVTATATCGLAVTSSAVRVNVVKPPTFSQQPSSKDLTAGEPLNLSLAASDGTRIQWFKDGKALVGQTGTTLNIPSVTMADAGHYYATVTNACSGISSAFARVSVIDPTALQPRLTMTPESADLGEIPLGYSATRTFNGLISNTGTADMQVSGVAITDPGFAVESGGGTPFTLAAAASSSVTIRATAENLSPMSGTLTVTTDAPVPTGMLTLTATPVLRYDIPTNVDYGQVFQNESDDSCITIVNNSTTDITIEQASLTGPDQGMWTINTPMPIAINAGASGEICLSFKPTSIDVPLSAQLMYTSSTGGNTSMNLSGMGKLTVGVSELDARTGVSVYPNPAREDVTIRTADASTITIVNARGVKVATLSTTADKLVASWNTKNFNGTAVAAGTYSVRISGLQGTVTVPLVVVR